MNGGHGNMDICFAEGRNGRGSGSRSFLLGVVRVLILFLLVFVVATSV